MLNATRLTIFLFFFFCISGIINAQDLASFQKRWLVQGADTLPYRILYPLNYDSSKRYPVLFFLHGGGERGTDNTAQLTHGGAFFLQERAKNHFPAFLVFPQCARNSYWSNVLRIHDTTGARTFQFLPGGEPTRSMQLLTMLVQQLVSSLPVNKEQVYVGGLSMGGMGTFELVRRMPKVFAAAFAICGGADPATAKPISGISWWIFHGLKDDVVDPAFSKNMATALKAAGAPVKLTLYPEAGHNSWDSAFVEKNLLPWLFSQHQKTSRR